MKKNCKQILTIRNIINSLTDIMTKHPSLNLDSEVIITDLNCQEFENVFVYLSKDVYCGNDRVGIQLSPKKEVESYEREGYIESSLGDIKGVVEEEVKEQEPVQTKRNWWDKYK